MARRKQQEAGAKELADRDLYTRLIVLFSLVGLYPSSLQHEHTYYNKLITYARITARRLPPRLSLLIRTRKSDYYCENSQTRQLQRTGHQNSKPPAEYCTIAICIGSAGCYATIDAPPLAMNIHQKLHTNWSVSFSPWYGIMDTLIGGWRTLHSDDTQHTPRTLISSRATSI